MKSFLTVAVSFLTIAFGVFGAQGADVAAPAKVAVYMDKGARSNGHYGWLRMVTLAEGLECVPVDAAMIRAGALDQVQMLVMPGGRSPVEAKTLGAEGRDRVRDFIRRGGGYVGTCAGCYLAMESSKSHPDMLHIAPFHDDFTTGGGRADMSVAFNARAKAILGIDRPKQRLRYAGGPILIPSKAVKDAKFEIIATYNSDINLTSSKARPSFAGKGAIAVGTYGKGRVFISAVHPEYDRDDHFLLKAAFEHVLGRKIEWRYPIRKRGQLAVGVVTDNSLGVATSRFLQDQFRREEFDLIPLNGEVISFGALTHVDAVIVPDTVEFTPTKGLLGGNLRFAREFVARGGKVIVWGIGAGAYAKIGAEKVEGAQAAVERLRKFASEPVTFRPERPAKVAKPVRMAIYTDNGGACFPVARALAASPEYDVRIVSAKQIGDGVLKDFDVVLQPGGGCHTQYTTLGTNGVEALRRFVYGGGKYYGICAGAFLATQTVSEKRPRIGLVPFKDDTRGFYNGWARTSMRITEEGFKVYGNSYTNRMIQYWGGPVMIPGDPVADSDVKVLVRYHGHTVNTCQPKAVPEMTGKAAILGGRVGKGKVYVQGPHPEKQADTFDMVISAMRYLTGVEPHPEAQYRVRGATRVHYLTNHNQADSQFFVDRVCRDPRLDVTFDSDADIDDLEHVDVVLTFDAADLKAPAVKAFEAAGGRVVTMAKRADGTRDYDAVIPLILGK